jgi:hypothetical protein
MEGVGSIKKLYGAIGATLTSVFVLLAFLASQAHATSKIALELAPRSAKVLVQHQIQFSPRGLSGRRLRWYVNGIPSGNATVGFISPVGLYTAPAAVPRGGVVTVKAMQSNPSRVANAAVTVIYETQTGAPLTRSKVNPRYFENPGGVVLLAGSHTWNDLRDMGSTDPPTVLDFDAYIAFLKSKNHNFTRLWAWDLPKSRCDMLLYAQPFPWVRSGPGSASDGKPKFNLRKFNSAYFDRLRVRVQEAQDNGIFVDVMLFEGYGVIQCAASDDGFPFYARNNVNGIDAARGRAAWKQTGSFGNFRAFPFFKGYFCYHDWVTGANPTVVAMQKAYVAKVLETLDKFDNVLYEIANEAGANSTNWQTDMISFIREYEAKLPKQHPVGFVFQYGTTCIGKTQTLLKSNADWISPGEDVGDYRGTKSGPALNDGDKVIVSDTDHLWGMGGTPLWVWKSFMRGMNLLYMDAPYAPFNSTYRADDNVRQAIGDVLGLSRRLPLARLVPSTTACSTGFAMVGAREYLCLAPTGGTFTVDLSTTSANFSVEWFDISTRTMSSASAPVSGGGNSTFSCPSPDNPCVLHLKSIAKS